MLSGGRCSRSHLDIWTRLQFKTEIKAAIARSRCSECGVKTIAIPWAIKENFRYFWSCVYAGNAEKFFKRWYSWAIRSRLAPIKKVAVMLKNHLGGLLSYFRHRATNATAERFNNRIQQQDSVDQVCRKRIQMLQNYRLRILFYCGKLELLPKRATKFPEEPRKRGFVSLQSQNLSFCMQVRRASLTKKSNKNIGFSEKKACR